MVSPFAPPACDLPHSYSFGLDGICGRGCDPCLRPIIAGSERGRFADDTGATAILDPAACSGTDPDKCPEVLTPIKLPGSRQYGQNLKSVLTKHFFADETLLPGYNLSLAATNDFEVQIDDSACAIEQHVLFLSAPFHMDRTDSARCRGSGRSVQTGECANTGDWVLDSGGQSRRSLRKSTSVLASRCVSNTPRGANRQGAARHGDRVVWQSVVDDNRGRELEVCPRKTRCRNWSASDRCRRRVLGAVYGGGLHTWNDSARTHPLWPGGLVRCGRRNVLGDLRWPHADQSGRGTSSNRSHGIIDAPHRHRHRAASFYRPHPSSVFAATDHYDPRLDTKGFVQG